MGLEDYQRKRNFQRTPEPAGKQARAGGRVFVVQKHQARQLHYDLRLELDGVLKSWAVPKGPSLDAAIKRLAIHVEDHPIEYGAFEGVIPRGEYGAGPVMLWDRGIWEPIGDAVAGYETGKLKFKLQGEKLRGAWMLVRTGKASNAADQRQWLLCKERDAEARSAETGDILETQPLSILTGRTLEEIAAGQAPERSFAKPAERSARGPKRRGKGPRQAEVRKIEYDAQKKQFAGVRLTSPEKVLYPEHGITKLELASFYRAIADWMLPHVADRPLALVRCPEGLDRQTFFQKHPIVGTPEALRRILVPEGNKTKEYLVVDDVAGLISLAQISALEIHAWGSRSDKLEFPDRLVFDLDPDAQLSWATVVQSAHQVRQFLQELGLESFVKTTGGKGLHLVVPIDRRHEWEEAKAFCKRVADLIVMAAPRQFTANMAKAARSGKIFIDYHRNGRGSTAIVPYSTRARPGAPVSTPLTWKELDASIPSDRFTLRNLAMRLASLKRDPWEGIESVRQGLAGPIKRIRALLP